MDSTLGSVQTDPHHGVAVAPLAATERWSGVEDALSTLAHRATRDIPDPPTRTEGVDVVVELQVAEPSVLATASNVATVPQAGEPPVRVTASDVFAGPQVGGPSVLAAVRPAEFRNAPFPSEP